MKEEAAQAPRSFRSSNRSNLIRLFGSFHDPFASAPFHVTSLIVRRLLPTIGSRVASWRQVRGAPSERPIFQLFYHIAGGMYHTKVARPLVDGERASDTPINALAHGRTTRARNWGTETLHRWIIPADLAFRQHDARSLHMVVRFGRICHKMRISPKPGGDFP